MESEQLYKKIPVDIITGFQGAGKTTFINTLLENFYRHLKVALFMNEDGTEKYIKNGNITIHPIRGGCICCTAQTELIHYIQNSIDKEDPARIIIELSGMGRIKDILTIFPFLTKCCPNQLIYILNIQKFNALKTIMGNLFFSQLCSAPVILVNRCTQLSDEDMLSNVKEIHYINKDALLFPVTDNNRLSLKTTIEDLSAYREIYIDAEGLLNPQKIGAFCINHIGSIDSTSTHKRIRYLHASSWESVHLQADDS